MTDSQTEARALWVAATREEICNDGDAIDIIATALAAKDAKWEAQLVETQRAWNERDGEKRLRLRAEAQLAEANKALETIRNYCDAPHWNADRRVTVRDIADKSARRAREQGEENG